MALSVIEQMGLTNGEIKPENHQLIDLVHHVAVMTAKSFYNTYKDGFDENLLVDAANYKIRMFHVCDSVFKQNVETLKSLTRIIIVIIGDSQYTLLQVENATDNVWGNFITEQMDEAFELLSGVKRVEKTEYDSI